MESYGDTILKLAATLLAYELKKENKKAGEAEIDSLKTAFVTNFTVFRVGYYNLRLQRYVRTMRDPEAKEWMLPL